MPSKFLSFLKTHKLVVLLIVLTLFICIRNYTPGTFLTGWDTLHPEFNYRIYWSRILGGVWQEHQGLGSVASQAHASEITRVPILMLFDIFLPTSMIRYAYAFLMLIIGPVGVYFFVKSALTSKFDRSSAEIGAFLGGLVYLLNLGTLQHFYVPLEMFLTHYGYLGWLFGFGTLYFSYGKKRDLAIFSVLNLLAASQAHTPTLFYAYLIGLITYFGMLVLLNKFSKVSIRAVIALLSYVLLVNLFWLLPSMYFVINHGKEIQESKIHHLFSQEAFLQNKKYGTIPDTAILRNFLFNWGEHVGQGNFGDLLNEWKIHLLNPVVIWIGCSVFVLAAVGLGVGIYKREHNVLAIGVLALLTMFFLLNVNPPLGFIFEFLQKNLPFFEEAFRFPFTKISILLMLCYGSLFGYFVTFLFSILPVFKKLIKQVIHFVLFSFITISLIYYMLPAFKGYLISPSMRVEIPNRYFEMFDYLDKQKEFGRVANLPIHSFWGWVYYDWNHATQLGYQGAGFLWFGIKQPLLDREFDRWNINNEDYYQEMSQAVYSQDIAALERTLTKFKVKWVLFDKSIISPGNSSSILYKDELSKLIKSSQKLVLAKDFGDGLLLYKYDPTTIFTEKETLSSFAAINNQIFKEPTDPIYEHFGDYAAVGDSVMPFSGITNYEEQILPTVVSADTNNVYFHLPAVSDLTVTDQVGGFMEMTVDVSNNILSFYDSSHQHVFAQVNIPGSYKLASIGKSIIDLSVTPQTLMIDTSVKEIKFYNLTPSSDDNLPLFKSLDVCSDIDASTAYSLIRNNGGFSLTSKSTIACVNINLANIFYKLENTSGLVFTYDFKTSGKQPEICILDTATNTCINTNVDRNTSYVFLDTKDLARYYLRISISGLLSSDPVTVSFSNLNFGLLSQAVPLPLNFDLSKYTITTDKLAFKKSDLSSGTMSSFSLNPRSCKTGSRDLAGGSALLKDGSMTYTTSDDYICDTIKFPTALHNFGHLLQIRAKHNYGLPIRVCLSNDLSKRCDLYVSLGENTEWHDYFYLIPPMGEGGGYTLNFTSLPIGGEPTSNEVSYVSLTDVPYDYLKSLVYADKAPAASDSLFVYNQAYEPGWQLFCGFRLCDAQHVKVNNWANGWISAGADARPVFVPQILEVLGLLVWPVLAAVFFRKKSN